MRHIGRSSAQAMLLSTSLTVLCLPGAGLAQTVAPGQPATEPVTQAEAVAPNDTEILVTAQRRSERLRDVPIAITALSAEKIKDLGIVTTQDIQLATPGLTFESGYGFSQPYIRGIGTSQPNPGLESAVASYYNGAYLVRSYGQIGRLFDMANIQILRGAQGTLYGRNATGGAILYTTGQPVLGETSFEATAEYGNQDYLLGEGVANLALGKTLALRVGYQASTDDGYVTNIIDKKMWGGGDHSLGRATLLWEPSSQFSATAMYERLDDTRFTNAFAQRAPGPTQCLYCGPPGSGPNPVSGFYQIAFGPTATPTKVTTDTAILRLVYQADRFDVTSITSYRKDLAEGVINVAASQFPFEDFFAASGGDTFTQEMQLLTKFDGIANGLVGFFYSDDLSYNHDVISGALLPLSPVGVDSDVKTKSRSVFGEIYIKPTKALSITLGLRYTSDARKIFSKLDANAAATFGFGNPSPQGYGNRKTFNEFTPRAVIAYDFGNVNAYASYNRGFKEGGYNTPTFQNVPPVNPETVDYLESGLKFLSPDRRGTLNLAAFYYKYKNIQVSIVDLASGTNILQNAAAARGYGAEIDGSYKVTDWLSLFGGVALLDAKFTSYPNASINSIPTTGPFAGFIVGTTTNLAGVRLPRAPSFQASLGATINAPISPGLTGHLSAIGRYTSSYDFYPGAQGLFNYARQEGYTIINLSGYVQKDFDHGSGGVAPRYARLGFFVNNATDKQYYALRTSQAFIGLLDVAAPPITYGLRIGIGF